MIINTHEAKTHLSKLIDRVLAGEEVIIGRAGTPVVRMVRYVETREPRKPGMWKGKVEIAPDFDETSDELIDSFESA